ncbi:MAG TPA: hypothetical protein VFA10_25050 [Ktedonobacteraceae bacterium]|nr:hypothetical protein [Ktedonobacteraceae bacterium]
MSFEKANNGITRQKSGSPRFADAGREAIPFLGKQFQIELGFGLGTGRVDRYASRSPPMRMCL